MGAFSSLATLGLNLALQRQAQRAEDRKLEKDRDRQLGDIAARDAEASRLQDLTLRRRLAEERARAGASGVGGTGGSADAILRGLEEEGRAVQAAQEDEVGAPGGGGARHLRRAPAEQPARVQQPLALGRGRGAGRRRRHAPQPQPARLSGGRRPPHAPRPRRG
jgi:hypothetical protein